jgi:hypothetical protein
LDITLLISSGGIAVIILVLSYAQSASLAFSQIGLEPLSCAVENSLYRQAVGAQGDRPSTRGRVCVVCPATLLKL